jgi:hypothetical protein
LWTGRWTTKLLDFFSGFGCGRPREAVEISYALPQGRARLGEKPRIRTVRQLTAVAGDGPLGSVGSPGQLETSLNSGYLVGPCNSYLEGPTLVVWACCSRSLSWACCSRNRAWNPPPSSSLAEERTPLLAPLRAAARDLPTLAAHVPAPSPTGRPISDARPPHSNLAASVGIAPLPW